MALFKNLYMDFSYLNPFKCKRKESGIEDRISPVQSEPNLLTNIPLPVPKYRELPEVSKKLLEEAIPSLAAQAEEKLELPKIQRKAVPQPPKILQEAKKEPEPLYQN